MNRYLAYPLVCTLINNKNPVYMTFQSLLHLTLHYEEGSVIDDMSTLAVLMTVEFFIT
jgi:hypothetical protein